MQVSPPEGLDRPWCGRGQVQAGRGAHHQEGSLLPLRYGWLDILLKKPRHICKNINPGGDIIPLLRDILYPNEKDALADKYKTALDRIGTLTNAMQPKQKSQVGTIILVDQNIIFLDLNFIDSRVHA